MGGLDDKSNIVKLTSAEHYVAHQLLVKMYPGVKKLVYAANMMTYGRKGNKSYSWIRNKFREQVKERMTGRSVLDSTKEKLRQHNLGKKHTESTIAKIAASGMRPCKEETKAKIGAANKINSLGHTHNRGRKRVYNADGTYNHIFPSA